MLNTNGIEIKPNASAPSALGDAELFNGHVVVNSLFPANEFTHGTGGYVTFAPSARTAWHTHPAGQMLIVTSGKGWVQQEGSENRDINPGDVVWIPVGVKIGMGTRQDRNGPYRHFPRKGRQERRVASSSLMKSSHSSS